MAPVLRTDAHLPLVAASSLVGESLRARFAATPVWQVEGITEVSLDGRGPVQAAVLIAIVLHAAPRSAGLLLTRRAQHLSKHPGQIAFPGGRIDPSDLDAEDAALREAWEEIGLERRLAEPIGRLRPYTTGTGFAVTPVVALMQPGAVLSPNPGEVDEVFEVPLDFLMNPANHRHHRMQWQGVGREWISMCHVEGIEGPERLVWGATAAMLRDLYRFLVS